MCGGVLMGKVMGGTDTGNVRRSFLPELISMNCMMGGMAPIMVLLMMGRDMRAMWPGEPLFWMVMSLAVIAGFAVAYPVNVWLVAHGMKHGRMSDRGSSSKGGSMAGIDHSTMHMAESPGMPGQAAGSAMHAYVSPPPVIK